MIKQTKIIIFALLTLLLMSSVNALTQTQLESYSNLQIRTVLINNVENKGINHKYNDFYKIDYVTKTIKKNYLGNYVFYDKFITTKLSKTDWSTCRKSYSLAICKTHLIYNYGYYNQETITLNNVTSLVGGTPTVYEQLKQKLIKEYNKIIYYRDNRGELEETLTQEIAI